LDRAVRASVEPVVRGLDATGIGPTALTFVGLAANLAAALVVGLGHLRWGAAAVLLASLVDTLDGSLARRQGKASRLGAFLDSTFDRFSETAIFLAILHDIGRRAWGASWLPEVTLAALAGSLAVSYVRARAEGLDEECRVGLLERPERIVLLVGGLILGRPVLAWVLVALAALTWVTVVQRIAHVWGKLAAPGGRP
jgi:CDP-diacylglycerol--glycerol-3-phosphate 3-phosphatidyltransferase